MLEEESQQLQRAIRKETETSKTIGVVEAHQKEMKLRFDKAIEDKVVENQRLKLDIADLQEEARKVIALKRQLEASDSALRVIERE